MWANNGQKYIKWTYWLRNKKVFFVGNLSYFKPILLFSNLLFQNDFKGIKSFLFFSLESFKKTLWLFFWRSLYPFKCLAFHLIIHARVVPQNIDFKFVGSLNINEEWNTMIRFSVRLFIRESLANIYKDDLIPICTNWNEILSPFSSKRPRVII